MCLKLARITKVLRVRILILKLVNTIKIKLNKLSKLKTSH